MGCDIHGFAEWKFRDAESKREAWSLIAPIPDMRSYRVFELLADVRASGDIDNQLTDTIPLRGVPAEYDGMQEIHGIDIGDHSFTWYTLAEINRPELWEQVAYELPRELWLAYINYLRWFRKSWYYADVRIVIGFDN